MMPVELQAQVLLALPVVEFLGTANVSRMWYSAVKRAIRQYCIAHFKLQWAPCVENSLLRGKITLFLLTVKYTTIPGLKF
jgi:hypothetical protein